MRATDFAFTTSGACGARMSTRIAAGLGLLLAAATIVQSESHRLLAHQEPALPVVLVRPAEHRERRRALVLSVLVGEDSKRAVADLIGPGRTSGSWVSDGAATLPLPALSQLNSRLLRYFVKRYTLKRGALAFGKMLPVGIGAVGAGRAGDPQPHVSGDRLAGLQPLGG